MRRCSSTRGTVASRGRLGSARRRVVLHVQSRHGQMRPDKLTGDLAAKRHDWLGVWDAAERSLSGAECGHEIRADGATALARCSHDVGVPPVGVEQSDRESDDRGWRRPALSRAWLVCGRHVHAVHTSQGARGTFPPRHLRPADGTGRPGDGRASGSCREITHHSAEGEGFEPSVGGLPLQRFSRPPRSTTPAPLQVCGGRTG
jgi:hypothetical protein